MAVHISIGILLCLNIKLTAGWKLYNQTNNKRIRQRCGAFYGPGTLQRVVLSKQEWFNSLCQSPVRNTYVHCNGKAILGLLQDPKAGVHKFYRNLENTSAFLAPDGRHQLRSTQTTQTVRHLCIKKTNSVRIIQIWQCTLLSLGTGFFYQLQFTPSNPKHTHRQHG
jgi:hypothetical protein